MIGCLLLRFDAPLMSFGGVQVDSFGITQDHPTLSQVVGLLGNALGYDHRDTHLLQRLQERLQYAARLDRRGEIVRDYQTVDLGQDFLKDTGWTTHGLPQGRKGAFGDQTHIRLRDYWADSALTVAVSLRPADEDPTLGALIRALDEPARPLFFGRKSCLPAAPVYAGHVQASDELAALGTTAASPDGSDTQRVWCWWPEVVQGGSGEARAVIDERDWANQIHGGRRLIRAGWRAMAPPAPLEGPRDE